jgi:hypothetical protein
MKPNTSKLTALAAVAAIGLGTAGLGSAEARHGADDPAGHVRHGNGADDGKRHAKRHKHHRRHHGAHHARHGADDGPNHT